MLKKKLLIALLYLNSFIYIMACSTKKNIDINKLKEKFGEVPTQTPLYYAAEHNNLELAKICIKNKICDVIRDDKGRTRLMMACKNLNLKLIKLFLDNGDDVHYTDSIGESALYYTLWNLEDCIKESDSEEDEKSENDEKKENCEERDIKKSQGIITIDCNIINIFKKIIKIFLSKGIDINYINNEGNTLLINAVKHNVHIDFIKVLIEFGSNPLLKNNANKRAVDYTDSQIVINVLNQCQRRSNCVIL